jgi:predicted DNA-binding antitoxin AbrB/MazE fold protein
MFTSFDAVYEDGVLKPLVPLPLNEHEKVRVIVSNGGQATPGVRNGSELVAYWKQSGVVGTRADIGNSQEHARELRAKSERRERS